MKTSFSSSLIAAFVLAAPFVAAGPFPHEEPMHQKNELLGYCEMSYNNLLDLPSKQIQDTPLNANRMCHDDITDRDIWAVYAGERNNEYAQGLVNKAIGDPVQISALLNDMMSESDDVTVHQCFLEDHFDLNACRNRFEI